MSPETPILLIEPYFGGSHRSWAEGVRDNVKGPVELLTLPARWWKWRMRGGAVTLAEMCGDLEQRPAAVLASDMIDLAAFRHFARPHIGDVPTGLYFHENQLTYPDSPQMDTDLHYAVTNWMSALAADRVFFNSRYHREAFFAELPRLLRHFPDFTHTHRIAEVGQKSEVLEVGVDISWARPQAARRPGPPRIVWNHRWEHDKDPEAFLTTIHTLAGEGLPFEVAMCGESFVADPSELVDAVGVDRRRITQLGYLPTAEYRRVLQDADIVVSTAHQEFFGVAVVEAVAAGCFPVLPGRLSYPELIGERWTDACLYPEGGLADRLRWAITNLESALDIGRSLAESIKRYGWETMASRYDDALVGLTRTLVV